MFKVISVLILSQLALAGLQAEDIDLFILAGQSNAQGWMGDAAKYPADPKKLDEKIRLWWTSPGISSSDGKWTTMQKQGGRFPAGHFGLEVSFARKLKENGYNPAIFKYTLGSTSIANNWKLPGKGGMYDNMVKDLKEAVSILEKEGHKVRFRGFIWIQGESDAQTKEMADAYEGSLKEIITDLRENVTKTKDMPVILGVDEQHDWVKNNPQVVTAQQHLAKTLKSCVWTSMKGLEKADSTHLTPEGLVKHGELIYGSFKKIDKKPALKPAVKPSAL